jgi:uncharacterized membrane protein
MFGIPLHLLAVHFPIALSVLALIYDARRSHTLGYALTLWAAAGAAVAGATGLLLAGERAATKGAIAHAGLGLIGTIVLIALAMLRYSAEARRGEETMAFPPMWLLLEVIGTLAVVLAALTGHWLALGV